MKTIEEYLKNAPTPEQVWANVMATLESIERMREEHDRYFQKLQEESERRREEYERRREEEEKRRREEEKRRMEEEKKRREEEEKRKREEEKRKQEEKKRRDEEKKRREEEEVMMKQREEKSRLEMEKLHRDTEREIQKLSNLFTTQWGKLVEALCTPAALKLFKEIGIGITQVYPGARKGKYYCGDMEVDIILCNTTVAVVVEVKTTCKPEDVDYFLSRMEHFKEAFGPFKNYIVYPAIAAIKFNGHSDKYALRKKMFVIHATGDGVFSLDKPKSPREY